MESGCVHEVDITHIQERGHYMQLLEYFIEKLLTTQNCTLEIIKALLGPEAAHLAASYGIEGLKGTRNLCLRVNYGHRSATVMVVVVKTPNCIKTKTVYPHPRCIPAAEISVCH